MYIIYSGSCKKQSALMQHTPHLTDSHKSMQWLCQCIWSYHTLLLLYSCRNAVDMFLCHNKLFWKRAITNAIQFAKRPLLSSHSNVYFQSFLGTMQAWAFYKMRLLSALILLAAHSFGATGALQQQLVPPSVILCDVEQLTGLTPRSPAGTTLHFHKLN